MINSEMIQAVHISGSGYRLLEDFQAEFRPLNVIIGANASAKSTLLDFLQFMSDLANFGVQEVADFHGGMFSIPNAGSKSSSLSWQVAFAKPTFNAAWKDVPIAPDSVFGYEVRLSWSQAGEITVDREKLVERHPTFATRTLLEAEGDRSQVYNERTSDLIPFDQAVSTTKSSPVPESHTGASSSSGGAPAYRGQALRLAQMRFLNEFPILSWARLIVGNFASYPGFDVSRNSAVRTKPSDIKAETTLAANGENLGAVLHEILTRYSFRNKAEELRDILHTAYPSFEAITAETGYGSPPKVLVRIRERGMSRGMELWDLSDGMLRFLCLSAALLNPFPAPVIAIDEPEAGFHPRMLPLVADLIKLAAEQSQIFVTTHSPELLNCFGLEDVAVMSRQDAKALWHRPSSHTHLAQLLEASSCTGESLAALHRSGELEAI